MVARQKFQKALMLLDRGVLDGGEEILRDVVADAGHESDQVALVQGLVCLGDLLFEVGRSSEGRAFLERALQETRHDDVLAREFARAKELLGMPG
ncbi:hypothetical protein [Paraburkholderia caribensis]|jgi:hypothetical protein|uniref:hypothetical protein n=1 Tax=Paraburkholderia caribensis TaxID=75105 RepID=UPI002862E412|nr:hypothetical protein [Paraburkholderia caribensis]MDR6382936.1 hypothetical protein [Paraburkholderia caribensis]